MSANKSDVDNHNVETKGSGRIWPDWYPALAAFRNSDTRKAAWQLINTLVPYCGLWYLMIRSIQLGYPYALTLILALPSAAFLVRIFILFHDCVHGSFFRRQGVNTFFGYLFGVLVFTSFDDWRFAHLRHHVTYANLRCAGIRRHLDHDADGVRELTEEETTAVQALPQSLGADRTGRPVHFSAQQPASVAKGEAKGAHERSFHQPGHPCHSFGCRPVHWMADVPPGPVAAVVFCGGGGSLAVLRTASVSWRVLGTQKRVGTIARRHGRQFILQIAACPALVFQQHRLPPCPSSEPQNPQLPPQEVLRCRSGVAGKSAAHNREKSFLLSFQNVG